MSSSGKVPRILGLGAHLALPNDAGYHPLHPVSVNASMDDIITHQHPGAVTSATPAFENCSSSNNVQLFGDSSTQHRPGAVSPRPSRGVGSSSSRAAASNYNGGHHQQQQEDSVRRQTSLRRSPSMPSNAATSGGGGGSGIGNATGQQASQRFNFDLVERPPLKEISYVGEYNFTGADSSAPPDQQHQQHHQWPVSCIAASSRGNCVAWGDASGRVFFVERGEDTPFQEMQREKLEEEQLQREEAENRSRNNTTTSSSSSSSSSSAIRLRPFSGLHAATAYVPFVDPLSSENVKPLVSAIAFLPDVGRPVMLLTANEKVPKLWRLVKVPHAFAPKFRAVDMIGEKKVGPIVLPEQRDSLLTEVRKFNVDHEYKIHSLCVIRDGAQFVSADDVTVRLWNVEQEHRGLLLSAEGPTPSSSDGGSGGSGEEGGGSANAEIEDRINVVHSAPHAPHALMVGMGSGVVRLCDLRCNLRLNPGRNSVIVGAGRKRDCDGLYKEVTTATLGCDLSLCGNYIAQRDVTCMHLFDVRRASSSSMFGDTAGNTATTTAMMSPAKAAGLAAGSSLVNRWVLQDHIARHLGQLYQLRSLFEKVSVRFVGRSRIVTGGFGECIVSVNALDAAESPDVVRIFGTEPEMVELPVEEGSEEMVPTTNEEDVARLYRAARMAKGPKNTTRLSFLSSAMRKIVGPGSNSLSSSLSVRCVTIDEGQEYQHQQQHSDLHEWKRITKLCVLPSAAWVTGNGSTGAGEVLAACGENVHHVCLPL